MWTSTVRELDSHLWEGQPPFFAKPIDRKKRFTGHVFRTHDDMMHLEDTSQNTSIWCAEVVEWLSVYRIFVIQGEIVGRQLYAGDSSILLNNAVVSDAIVELEMSDQNNGSLYRQFRGADQWSNRR